MGNLSDRQRECIIRELLVHSITGKWPHGAKTRVTSTFKCHTSAITRIWARYQSTSPNDISGGEWKSKIKANAGRKRLDRVAAAEKLKSVPIEDRQVERRAAEAAGTSRHMVRELMKEGTASRVSTRIKPALTAKNKLHHVESALIYIDDASMDFETMEDVVHVDEKWFNEDKNKRSYIVFEGEAPPTRSRRSKNFIPKTMFLAAVARPRFDPHRNSIWDGKLGIWAFTEEYVAQRRSKYRTKGTLCVRNIESVTRDVYKEYLLTFLIPSIKAKWPAKDRSRPILIQQDNAKPHVSPFDPDIVAAGSVDGWFIRLIVQPPNSPDYNALDLGLFASIQSIQYRYAIRGINNLIDVVEAAYEELSTTTQDNVFLTLQACMLCVLEADGGNDYKIPHQSKEKLRRAGLLPRVLTCDRALYERSCQLLRDAGRSWFPGSSQ